MPNSNSGYGFGQDVIYGTFLLQYKAQQKEYLMALTTAEILNIAKLARLHVEESELADYQQDLSAILGFVEQMEQVNVDGVEPMAHPQDMSQSLREDVVTESDQRERFQSIAPATANGLYLVPKVIE